MIRSTFRLLLPVVGLALAANGFAGDAPATQPAASGEHAGHSHAGHSHDGHAHGAPAAAPATTAEIGKPAPDFSLQDLDGKDFKLSANLGKKVVIEWYNPDCPFIKHAHTKGDLKDQGNRLAGKGVVFVAINSSAPGREGAGLERNLEARKEYGIKFPVLLDPTGAVGRLYGARTTPHMFLIDEKGTLVYKGAIDNAPFGEIRTGTALVNHLDTALAALAAGKPIEPAESTPYGCSVKYAK